MPAHPALKAIVGPADPRTDLVAFGAMPVVDELDELVTRVLAPNASPMTLDGTNTYVIGEPGSGSVVVVDPGPTDGAHLDRLVQAIDDRDAEAVAVLVTHHHHDHAEAAVSFADRVGAEVVAPTRAVAGPSGRVIADGELVQVGPMAIEAVATPGHSLDHTAYRLPNGMVLSGDHVLGRGTSVVAHPDGDLAAYLRSLRRLLDLGPDALLPGHGPELLEDPTPVLDFYLEHRSFREQQVLALIGAEPMSARELVRHIYAEVPKAVWGAAELSTRAALEKLQAEGRIEMDRKHRARPVDGSSR